MTIHIGVDLGGTKVEAVVLEVAALGSGDRRPKELARARVPTNRTLGYDHVVEQTRALIERVAKDAGIDATSPAISIGVGMPGSTTTRRADGARSDTPLVKNSNTTCLNGQPFHRDLSAAVGRSLAFANDANCFALAEAMWGAARGARLSFGVILGTGVGGGLVIAPSSPSSAAFPYAWSGAQGIAGEWGHVVLVPSPDARLCYCGRRGCIETYLSGPAIESTYAARAGTPRKLVDIARGLRDGSDAIAAEVVAECMDLFGRALATVINIVDPDVIVLGGGVSNLDVLYTDGREAVARWVFNDVLETKIVKNELGDSAGVFGAALL